jgi:hypothetical protein
VTKRVDGEAHGRGRDGRSPGLVIVQMDGVSRPELERLVRAGRMPVLARLIEDGRLEIGSWTPLLPPCTPASQAGILHGANDGIPGFRWYEKDDRRLIVANHAGDAAEIDARISDGDGLLVDDGVSIGNLLGGDSSFSHLTMATIAGKPAEQRDGDPARDDGERRRGDGDAAPRRGPGHRDSVRFTINPFTYLWIVGASIVELIDEIRGARRQRLRDVKPRMRRGVRYAMERVLTNVPLRILSTKLARAEIRRGRRIIYVDFTGYDEIAHHCGPGRRESARAAERIDRSLGRIVEQIDRAERPYGLVVLSDHGQSLGETFRQRYGRTLEEEIAARIGQRTSIHGATDHSEYDDGLARLVDHVIGPRLANAVAGLMERRPGTNHHRASRVVDSRGAPLTTPADAQVADVVVCASGNLGLVYLTSLPGRATREAIEARYPGLIEGLVNHPGIDMIVARSSRGIVVIGEDGTAYLDEGRVEGVDPLRQHHAVAADGIRRLFGFDNAGDMVAIGHFDPTTGTVISFEELVGSHGGLGGPQGLPFLAAPPGWPRISAELVGAPEVHRQLDAWLADLPSLVGSDRRHDPRASTAARDTRPTETAARTSISPSPEERSPEALPVGSEP